MFQMKSVDRAITEGILFTDQYQLTMAQLYFRMGLHEKPAQFDHTFRSYPDYGIHQAGYCINAGLEWLLGWMQEAHFGDREIEFLRHHKGSGGKPLFSEDFLGWLRANGTFDGINLWAIPEGRVVHPNVPVTIVQGPLAVAQILETPLLNHLNFQTLIATKAARIRESGHGQMLLEFGLRRAQGMGANAGARAAMIGGADFSSNVGISHTLGLPPKGTHASSMIQIFLGLGHSELDAFRAYAEIYPDDCLLLVDTINTLESGVPNAIRVFEELRQKGHRPLGIRLDSGDLAFLSIQAAKMLDEAGFPEASIVLSNQLDELVIWQICTQIQDEASQYGVDPEALIDRLMYGVGTRLITSEGHSAMDGVYKLVAMKEEGTWVPLIKISETAGKTPDPGPKRIWRIYDERNKAAVDLISLEDENPSEMDPLLLHHPTKHTAYRSLSKKEISFIEPLLEEILKDGELIYTLPTIEKMRDLRNKDLSKLDPGVRRIVNPHIYHVSITKCLWDLKAGLIKAGRPNDLGAMQSP
jgi:nicotinate phosphoribosyltransferase